MRENIPPLPQKSKTRLREIALQHQWETRVNKFLMCVTNTACIQSERYTWKDRFLDTSNPNV